jgi:glucose/arabinose dehydrogenase
MSRLRPAAALLAACLLLAGCGVVPGLGEPDPGGERGIGAGFGEPEVVAGGLEAPWGLAFLPDKSALVSERDSGRILQVRPGAEAREAGTVPGVVAGGEGGLLGLAVSPAFERDQLVYAYCSAATDNRIVRFRLGGGQLEVLVEGIPKAGIHNGGRIAFGPDGMLYAGTGDASEGSRVQDPASLGGKVLRLRPDGAVPADNPFPGSPVWTVGHRNVQGLAWDDAGRMFASELGQNRRDEVNRIEKGANYGWPEVEGPGAGSGSATRWSPGRPPRRRPAGPRSPAAPCSWPPSGASGCGRCRWTAPAGPVSRRPSWPGPTAACATSP